MSRGPAASLPTSVGELRALVVELVEVNAGPREVIAAKDHQIASLERPGNPLHPTHHHRNNLPRHPTEDRLQRQRPPRPFMIHIAMSGVLSPLCHHSRNHCETGRTTLEVVALRC
jgi:hypothetical protein